MIKTLLVLAILPLILVSVFAQESFISVQTDKSDYFHDDIIYISGTISESVNNEQITCRIDSPSGSNIVFVGQTTINSDNTFEFTVPIGPIWSEQGEYRIIILYSQDGLIQKAEITVNVYSELPYFPLILNSNHNNTLSQQLDKWNTQLNQTTYDIEKNMILYNTAINNNSTIQIETYTKIIGDLLAIQNIYSELIDELRYMLNFYS